LFTRICILPFVVGDNYPDAQQLLFAHAFTYEPISDWYFLNKIFVKKIVAVYLLYCLLSDKYCQFIVNLI